MVECTADARGAGDNHTTGTTPPDRSAPATSRDRPQDRCYWTGATVPATVIGLATVAAVS
jgi:hypothetical protein